MKPKWADGEKLTEELKSLYKKAEALSDDLPSELAKKIFVYTEIYGITGRLMAASVYDYEHAYAVRKMFVGDVFAKSKSNGDTDKKADATAEFAVFDYREAEAVAKAEMTRWDNAHKTIAEQIQAMKKELDVLRDHYNGKSN